MSNYHLRAQLFLEVLLSLFVLSIILVGVLSILSLAPKITFYSEKNQNIQNLLNEYVNIALYFRDKDKYEDIENLSDNQEHSFKTEDNTWDIDENKKENVAVGGETYKRYFKIDNYAPTPPTDASKIFTIYLTSTSTSENLQLIITEWP